MQTFLPYQDFSLTAKCLDYKRLGKQRVECLQILKALCGLTNGWANHPATKMWAGCEDALLVYMKEITDEWINRGYKNNITLHYEILNDLDIEKIKYPKWLGKKEFHDSHKSNLLRKDFEYYKKFNWGVPNDLPYIWPKV